MSKFSKITSVALTVTTTVWLSGALLLIPASAGAQSMTAAQIQAQIASLLQTIDQLKAQLGTSGGSMTSTFDCTKSLTVGSKGDGVTALQQLLIGKGYLKIAAPTGYFGALTKAAVAAWQAASGISPAAGYFGPKSCAAVNAMGSTTPTPTPTPGVPAPVPGTGLTVSLSSSNPVSGSLISSSGSAAARVPVLAINLTAGVGSAVNVTSINLHKTGVISDSSISGAYLIMNGKVIAQYNSISQGVINFSGLVWSIPAGQTQTVWLAIDPAAGLSAGNTVGFSLNAATDITAADASGNVVTAGGVFPLTGNTFTVTSVSNPSIASLSIASSAIGTAITAGTTNNLIGAFNFTVQNSKVWLKGLNFRVIGSANKTDIKNVVLKVNGTQVGTTLPNVGSDGSAYFDASANPGVLNTGSNNLQVFADVLGSPSYNFQFEILNSYDIYAVDSQYNVPIAGASNVGTLVSINPGTITVTQATNTPTGSLAKGQSGVALAKINFYAGGEPVKVKWLGVALTFSGLSATSSDGQIKNLSITDDAGGQIGTTINSLATAQTCTDSAQVLLSAAGTSAVNCFGNNSSPINYIVPANTTRVLTIRADIQSTASFSTVLAALTGNTSNLQGLTSSATASSGSVGGTALTLASASLTITKNSAIGTQNVTPSSGHKKIGSYAFTAASAEGATLSTVSVTLGAAGGSFQNLMLQIGATQFGTTQGVLGANGVYSFSGNSFTVPAGGTTIVDVYADVLSGVSAGTKTAITTLSGCSGSGAVSFAAISCSSTTGQDVFVSGQPTLQVAIDQSTPASNQVVMGSTGNSLATFRFSETSNVEDVKITDLNIFDQVAATTSVKSAFGNVSLYKVSDGTLLGTAGSANVSANTTSTATAGLGYYYKFHFGTPIVVPQAGSLSVILKADVGAYSSSAATDNTTHTFKIATTTDSDNAGLATSTIIALGNSSNASATVAFANGTGAAANAMTVLRSKAIVSVAALGGSAHNKAVSDDIGTITFAADSAGSVVINTVTVTFGGSNPSASAFLGNVSLLDQNGNSVMNTSGVTSSTTGTCTGSNTCSKSWNFGATTAGWSIINNGQPYTFKLRVNSNSGLAAIASVAQTLSATINATTDITYTDGVDGAASTGITLPTSASVPITINSISYPIGT